MVFGVKSLSLLLTQAIKEIDEKNIMMDSMKKFPEGKVKYVIEWLPVATSEPIDGKDHGIEFHHRRGTGYIVIGFIKGFDWLNKRSVDVNVYYLSPESGEWGDLSHNAHSILNDLKDCVSEVLEKKLLSGEIRENIRIWANG